MSYGLAPLIRVVILTLTLASLTVFAHHGSAGYNTQRPVTLTGVITRVELVNPHSFVYIDVKDASGHTENWALEGSPPAVLTRSGWTKETLMPGTELTVIGYLPRDHYPVGHIGTFNSLDQALAYSPGALDHLRTAHILQTGEIRIGGQNRIFGMGPNFAR